MNKANHSHDSSATIRSMILQSWFNHLIDWITPIVSIHNDNNNILIADQFFFPFLQKKIQVSNWPLQIEDMETLLHVETTQITAKCDYYIWYIHSRLITRLITTCATTSLSFQSSIFNWFECRDAVTQFELKL